MAMSAGESWAQAAGRGLFNARAGREASVEGEVAATQVAL